jgi:hypothetical protein
MLSKNPERKSAWQRVREAFRPPEGKLPREDGFVFVIPLSEEQSHLEGDPILLQAASGKRPE